MALAATYRFIPQTDNSAIIRYDIFVCKVFLRKIRIFLWILLCVPLVATNYLWVNDNASGRIHDHASLDPISKPQVIIQQSLLAYQKFQMKDVLYQ